MLKRISEGASADEQVLSEDFGDLAFYGNFGDFVRRAKGKTGFASDQVVNGVTAAIQKVFSSPKFMQDYRQAVLRIIRTDKALLAAITRDGFQINEAEQMNDIARAVFETTEDGELPFHGELVVEGDDGQSVTLDEVDVMEDVVIETLENAIADAVAQNPNAHVQDVRAIDEALQEGNYEIAVELGTALLRKLGVDEAQIDEFKKGFKVSGSQRARIARMRKKPKTGSAMMALRARRRAARKSSSRMKRARYYKQNKRRIARRRAQLQNSASINLDANQIVEMAQQGLTVVIVQEGEDPLFVSSREIAEQIADENAVVIELSDEQIDEACKKAGGKRKGKMPPKMADDETDESLDEENCDDEEDDDEEDYVDDEEEDDEDEMDDETDESIDEADKEKPFGNAGKTNLQQKLQIARNRAAAAKRDAELRRKGGRRESVEEGQLDEKSAAAMANEVAKFLKAHPDVGYGELATRFKIGRDVAQQAVILAGNVAGGKAKGDQASWLYLAKEILGKLMAHSAGAAPDSPGPAKFPAKDMRQVASIDQDEADLVEDDESEDPDDLDEANRKPRVVISAGNKSGATKVAKATLPKAKLKGKEGAIKSAHSTIEHDDDPDAQDSGLVEVTVPMAKADALVAAAARHGLASNTAARLNQATETVTLMVPARLADAIRADVA